MTSTNSCQQIPTYDSHTSTNFHTWICWRHDSSIRQQIHFVWALCFLTYTLHEKPLGILRVSNPATRKDLAARTWGGSGINPKCRFCSRWWYKINKRGAQGSKARLHEACRAACMCHTYTCVCVSWCTLTHVLHICVSRRAHVHVSHTCVSWRTHMHPSHTCMCHVTHIQQDKVFPSFSSIEFSDLYVIES